MDRKGRLPPDPLTPLACRLLDAAAATATAFHLNGWGQSGTLDIIAWLLGRRERLHCAGVVEASLLLGTRLKPVRGWGMGWTLSAALR